MAPADTLSPAGSSTYSSNTLYVGDGTWDSSKNDFLLPNLVGLNFATMQYNGMGNRFSTFAGYHTLIKGHAICAVIVFLFFLPFSIMSARFRTRDQGSGVRYHIYLNILSLFLSTVVFILGWFAVGPNRSLTNPHHGIGLAIYVLILVQTMGGAWVRGKLRKHVYRRLPIKLMLHQWLGRSIVLLGIVQVPLGLTLYGSPKWTFVLYTLWMTFLMLLYFILTYRAGGEVDRGRYSGTGGGTTVITEEKKSGGIGKWLAPLAAGGAIAALLSRRKSNRERDDDRSRVEVIPSRRGSRRGSVDVIEEEKYTEGRRKESGGVVDKLLAGGALLGAGALAKAWWERRTPRRNVDEEYSAVASDTPNRLRRKRRPNESVYSDETTEVRRNDRGHGAILPGPGNPLVTAAAISAATEGRPRTPAPIGRPAGAMRRESVSSLNSSYGDRPSPSRRETPKSHGLRNTVLAGIGLGWLGKRFSDNRERKEQERLDEIREREREDEARLESDRRHGVTPSKFTADGRPPRTSRRPAEVSESSDMSSDVTSRVERRGAMPPLVAGVAGAAMAQSRSRHNVVEPVPMPTVEPRRSDFYESGSEAYNSPGGRQHRRHSSGRGRGTEAAEAAAAGAGLALAAEEAERRKRERSRASQGVDGPPVSVKVQMHGDKDRKVTLRRLTEEEAAAERDSRSRRQRGNSVSSMSGSESATNNRYRREASSRREAERRAEASVAGPSEPLSPPRPAFAGGRQPKDSSYYSGPPAAMGSGGIGSPDSHGTRSGMSRTGMSPSGTAMTGEADMEPAERRRRRRLERNQRQAAGTMDYE